MLTWERPVSVSFAQTRSYPASTAWKKVRDLCRRTGRSRIKRAMVALHNFQGALSTTDGKTDSVARPAGSWNPIRWFLGRGCLPTRNSVSWESHPERVPNVFFARVIWHSLSACTPNSGGRPARYVQICRDKTFEEGSSRDIVKLFALFAFISFFVRLLSLSDLFFERLDDVG